MLTLEKKQMKSAAVYAMGWQAIGRTIDNSTRICMLCTIEGYVLRNWHDLEAQKLKEQGKKPKS